MTGYRQAVELLPQPLRAALLHIPPAIGRQVQEIRLRAGQAVALGIGGEIRYVTDIGALTDSPFRAMICEEPTLRQTVDRLTAYSAYAHQDTLRLGFVTTGGCRVGIAGTAITDGDRVTGYRSLTALCLRVARSHTGCAAPLLDTVYDGAVRSTLICSEPSGGKTSLLRDLAVSLAAKRIPVCVVDERGELSGTGTLAGCEVLLGTPKAIGIEQAVRCLAPRVILFDELGDAAELSAVHDAAVRGVPVIATAHANTPDELLARAALKAALESGLFTYLVFLHGRSRPGEIRDIVRTEAWLHETLRRTAGTIDRCGDRLDGTAHAGAPYTGTRTV